MEEEISVRSAEEKAIKEAEYIAASESIKLIQELSLRLETSEPSSKPPSRNPSITVIEENNASERESGDQPGQIIEDGNQAEKETEEDGQGNDEESQSQDESAPQASNAQEPIIEMRDGNDDGCQMTKQESKLVLSEFNDDSISFKEEQQETNGHSDDSDVIVLEESNTQDLNESENLDDDEIVPIKNQEPLEIEGCGHKLREISGSTKSGIYGIIEFQKSIFNNCRNGTNSINSQLNKSSWDYFDSFHSKLIKLAGFHSPDECSICKDFKHQDVPLLN